MRIILNSLLLFLLLFLSRTASAQLLNQKDVDNINIRATQFANNVNLDVWKIKLDMLVETRYLDNCGEGRYIPKKGFDLYCRYYYTYVMAKEKGFKDNLTKKYQPIAHKSYEIANSDNSDFNEFFIKYGQDKIAYDDVYSYKNKCDAQYPNNKFLANSCIVSLANQSPNPFNKVSAFCYYGLSKVRIDDGVSYRTIIQSSAEGCVRQMQQNYDPFIVWEAYMGYKIGAALAVYANKNKSFDFLLSF